MWKVTKQYMRYRRKFMSKEFKNWSEDSNNNIALEDHVDNAGEKNFQKADQESISIK